MSRILEAIKEQSRLARMRMGQDAPEYVEIPSMPGIRCVMVPLLEKEAHAGVLAAASLKVDDNAAGMQLRNRVAIDHDVWNALRDPDDTDKKVFESVDQMTGLLDPSDIDHLADELTLLMDYASPTADGLSDAEVEELKKAFAETDWSALTGRRWAAVKLCVSTLFPELLVVKSRGSGSTDSATTTNGNDAST